LLTAPAPAAPVVLTLRVGRKVAIAKLSATRVEASALSFNITRCHRAGSTVVCSFSMRMRLGVTCTGRVQIRAAATGGYEGRYVGPPSHPVHVICK
jgi:hypothetical protein